MKPSKVIPFVTSIKNAETKEELHKLLAEFDEEYEVKENSSILNQTLLEADIPEGVLIVMIKRNNEIVIPNGSTVIMLGDILVLSGINTDDFHL